MFFVVPEASNAFTWMFFDALDVQGPSLIDPGLIWEKSFFMIFLKMLTLNVDEGSCFTIPRINRFEQTQCDSKLK